MSEQKQEGWIDWESHAISLLISGPIFSFGYAAASIHIAWILAAVAWHFAAGFVLSVIYYEE